MQQTATNEQTGSFSLSFTLHEYLAVLEGLKGEWNNRLFIALHTCTTHKAIGAIGLQAYVHSVPCIHGTLTVPYS